MKQIYIWVTALLLITGCIDENGGNEKTSQMILGIVNTQQSKISINDDRKSSDLIIYIPTFYVDSISGNDSTTPGTKSAPFRTITKAILALKNSNVKVIAVAPGTYDGTIGETFSITIPEGVNIYGDINGKGLIGGTLLPFMRDHREQLQKRESL
ncbi:PF07602 domain protein [Leptospira alexanderi serovar Manhao 3 str. L 60]|uniref:PF07602 domain protein n=1 Tax=Leptospira alexanderi serovar Manhao 3 str. L 60 TaxID=1049759 RepID=V6I0V7_9LEPT|nr:PF07602 domain protein [Leptospira alexanderi serovar Manhao 3 str. L 60]